MGSKLTKGQIDRLKKLSQEFATIAREGKKPPATSATLAEPAVVDDLVDNRQNRTG